MNNNDFQVSLLIPTFNAGALWDKVLQSVATQTCVINQKIIVDSGSSDHTIELAIKHGFKVIQIAKEQFNHGATRQLLVDKADQSTICVFLTQDAILASNESIQKLVEIFINQEVGLAYGRQLPHENAKPLEIHARLYNYPARSQIRSFEDKNKLGFKVFFCSNSFAAYRRNALLEIGGFPSESIMGEDAIVAAKMLQKGYKSAYVAEAIVNHSHSYSLVQEFRRYFDTRVFHEQNKWLLVQYGKPNGEGVKYVKSELKFIAARYPKSIFKSAGSIFSKWLGYSIARYYRQMSPRFLRMLSMHKAYWG